MTGPRVLITGASGLLGTAMVERLHRDFTLLAFAHSNPFPGMKLLDLLQDDAEKAVEKEDWQALIHCAAFRNPDYCDIHRGEARLFNAGIPAKLASCCARRNARMIHISTDYVFDGTHPPYHENDTRNPVNFYGETKKAAEDSVLQANPNSVVMRIPALYGTPPAPVKAPFFEDALNAAFSETPSRQDAVIIRHPTHTADVAEVTAFLIAHAFRGILHVSATEPATKYTFALAVARQLGRPTDHLLPFSHDPDRKATRPINPKLDTTMLASIGAPMPLSFQEHLPAMLAARLKGTAQ